MTTATGEELTTRIEGVELLAVGTHDAQTGKARITTADLAAMVDAYQNPKADAAPLKLGHDDDRFQDANGNPPTRRDGEPAYGWVENLRLSADKKTLVGDLVGVPKMLAEIMDTAFRRRSVELVRQERVGGKVYAAVLTGLSLLGVQAPAVKGLADLRALFAEDPEGHETVEVVIEDPPDAPVVPQTPPETPQRDPETLSGPTPRTGATMRLTKTQRAALGIPDGATIEQVKKILADRGLHMGADDTYEEDNEEVRPNQPDPANSTPQPGTVTPQQPSGSQEQPQQTGATGQTPNPAPTGQQSEQHGAANPPTAEAIMLAAGNLGLTVVDRELFGQLQADAAAGRAARDEQNNARWDSIVRDAVNKGKLAPTAFSLWRQNIAENPELVIKLLAGLPEDKRLSPAVGHSEAYSGGMPGDPATERTAHEAALTAKRAAVWEHFGIPSPTTGN